MSAIDGNGKNGSLTRGIEQLDRTGNGAEVVGAEVTLGDGICVGIEIGAGTGIGGGIGVGPGTKTGKGDGTDVGNRIGSGRGVGIGTVTGIGKEVDGVKVGTFVVASGVAVGSSVAFNVESTMVKEREKVVPTPSTPE